MKKIVTRALAAALSFALAAPALAGSSSPGLPIVGIPVIGGSVSNFLGKDSSGNLSSLSPASAKSLLAIASGDVSGLGALATVTPGTGVATALAVNVGSAGAFVTFNGALGTPSSGTATNLTGTASGLTAGNVSGTGVASATSLALGGCTISTNNFCVTGTSSISGAETAASFIPSGSTVPSNGIYLSAANQVGIATNTTARWNVTSSGHILAATDNSFDIGANGATRPRDIYTGGMIKVGSFLQADFLRDTANTNGVQFPNSTSMILGNTNRTLIIWSAAASTAPALKRFGNALAHRQGDDTLGAFSAVTTCAAAGEGALVVITDSNTSTWGATIAGGGANRVLGYCNGSNWTVAAK